MSVEIFEMILCFIGFIFFMVFIGTIVGGGLSLICRPLGHQYEWEKRLQGECPINKSKNQGDTSDETL